MKRSNKKRVVTAVLVMTVLCIPGRLNAQLPLGIAEIIKAGIVKVIKSIDLKMQRLQNQTIALQNAHKIIENELTRVKLDEIVDWNEKQKEQFRLYYDELRKVKTIVSSYQRIRDITRKQARLVSEYQRVWSILRSDERFTASEIAYMAKVYSGIMRQSLQNMQDISLIVRSYSFQMSDGERLRLINEVADKVDQNFNDLKSFNYSNAMLSLRRGKGQQEIQMIKKLYGLE